MSILDRILRRKRDFTSHDQLFRAVDALIAHLRDEGKVEVAEELARAWGGLNGSSDGWALFLDAIDSVDARHPATLDAGETAVLRKVGTAVRRLVRR